MDQQPLIRFNYIKVLHKVQLISPLLNFYVINIMQRGIEGQVKPEKYADDTIVFVVSKTIEQGVKQLILKAMPEKTGIIARLAIYMKTVITPLLNSYKKILLKSDVLY